jgi:hypothetical protein
VGVQQDKYGTVIMPPPPTTGQPAQSIRRARLTEELYGCVTAGIVLLNPPSGSGGSEGSCLCDYTDGESGTVLDDAGLVNEYNGLTLDDPAGNFYLPIEEEGSPIILEVQPPSADSQGLWRLVSYGLGLCVTEGSQGSGSQGSGSEGSGSAAPPCLQLSQTPILRNITPAAPTDTLDIIFGGTIQPDGSICLHYFTPNCGSVPSEGS